MFWFFVGLILFILVTVAERALVGLSPHDLEQLRLAERPASRNAYLLGQEDIRSALTALMFAKVFLQVILVVIGCVAFFGSEWIRINLANSATYFGWPEFILWGIASLSLSILLALLFWGIQKTDLFKSSSSTLFWVQRLTPFIYFWKKLFSPVLPKEPQKETHQTGTPHDHSNTTGNSEKREMELLKSIVKFSDVTVKQVMQPRTKVVGVDFRTDFHELLQVVRESEFSRLPVYDDDLDNITGILYVKDLLLHLDAPAEFEWQPLIRTNVMLVPESKRCSELLEEFKQQKIHMAVVVDEYGGSAGIVTMEDILEEITGDIRDEFDEDSEIRYRKLDEYTYLFEGPTLLNDVCRIAGLDAAAFDAVRGNADTLAGLVLELRGDIPKTGVEIPWNGYLFTITAADNRRVSQIKLGLPRLGN